MALLDDKTKEEVKKRLDEMESEVRLIFFTSKDNQYGSQQKEIVDEVVSIAKKVKLESYDLTENAGKAKEYEIDKTPAIILKGKEKGIVRFFGLTAGYEFATLLAGIIAVSTGKTPLPKDVLDKVKQIDFPVHIEVFATPQCPYCPGSVKLAHDLAIVNENVKADMIEAAEFQDLVQKHEIKGVPSTIINGKLAFSGGQPPDLLLAKIMELKK